MAASLPLLSPSSRSPISQPFPLPELGVAPLSSSSPILRAASPLLSSPIRPSGKARSFAFRISLYDSPSNAALSLQHDQESHEAPAWRSIWVNPNMPRGTRRRLYDPRYDLLAELARSLDACNGSELDVSRILLSSGAVPSKEAAIGILNRLKNPESALLALHWFQEKIDLKREVVLYNLALKVFKRSFDWDRFSSLLNEMLGKGIKPDDETFSTVVSCAVHCRRPELAVEWFRRMLEFGLSPDRITLASMIEAYARSGDPNMACELYARARKEKWMIRARAFATIIRVYTVLGDFDGALNVFDEMKALGVKPSLSVFNMLLIAMEKASRPWLVKATYGEMVALGILPSRFTYSTLLCSFAGARYGYDALSVYRKAKEEGVELEVAVYNMLLKMCADLGLVNEVVEIFEDMKKLPGNRKPDSWSYSCLVSAYSIGGQVSELERALKEMREAGLEPNVTVLTSVIMWYGKFGRTDVVVRAVSMLLEFGMGPDERFCGCLLSVMTRTPVEDADKLIRCIFKSHAQLGSLVRLLVDENSTNEVIKKEAEDFIEDVSKKAKKTFCDFLIDICINRGFLKRACVLLDIAVLLRIYLPLQSKTSMQWSLHLTGLSPGAALAALHVWMNDLHKALEKGEEFPPVLGINTSHGKPEFLDKGLSSVFESHLKELKAPFHKAPNNIGWLSATKTAAQTWLKSISSPELVSA